MTIAVDFDGTIVEHRYPAIGKEIPFAIDTLKRLAADHHRLILWTAREGQQLEEAIQFCHERGLDFYAVNCDIPDANWDNYKQSRKLKVDVFIDDRNLGGLPDWATIYEMVSRHLTYGDLLRQAAAGEFDDEETETFWSRFKEALGGNHGRHRHHSSHHW